MKLRQLLDVAIQHCAKVSFLGYICGIIWLLALAHPSLNNRTYFSENALLPGMVDTHYDTHNHVKMLKRDIEKLTSRSRNELVSWLIDKMQSIGLEAYQQNFTVTIPGVLSGEGTIYGNNVYGILRAPRLPATEALVFSVAFKNEENVKFSELVLLLSLAEHFRTNIYWAKDIIFLVVDKKELGMQSWLDEYHGCMSKHIRSSPMLGRSGAIQAAINFDLEHKNIDHMEVLVEGLNGQLPNLDLVNMVIRLCEMEGIRVSLKQLSFSAVNDDWDQYRSALSTMGYMMFIQASGRPSSNHGFFPKYGIEAVTLRGIRNDHGHSVGIARIGRALEGMFRSLNNLLERFHQSFFFYLLPDAHRYVSIGLYMPPLACLVLGPALYCIACWLWSGEMQQPLNIEKKQVTETYDSSGELVVKKTIEKTTENNFSHQFSPDEVAFTLVPRHFNKVFRVVLAAHIIGLLTYTIPYITEYIPELESGLTKPDLTIAAFSLMFLCSLFLPSLSPEFTKQDVMLLKSFALAVLVSTVGCFATVNFSFSYFISVLTIPSFLIVNVANTRSRRFLQVLLVFLASPPVTLFLLTSTFKYFTSTNIEDNENSFEETLLLFKDSILRSLRDSVLFGSWSFAVTTLILFPNWLVFWCIAWT